MEQSINDIQASTGSEMTLGEFTMDSIRAWVTAIHGHKFDRRNSIGGEMLMSEIKSAREASQQPPSLRDDQQANVDQPTASENCLLPPTEPHPSPGLSPFDQVETSPNTSDFAGTSASSDQLAIKFNFGTSETSNKIVTI